MIFLIFLQCTVSQAEQRSFVRVNLCGLYDDSWKGRRGDDGKCLITEIVCQRSGNQYVAGSVDASLGFKSFQAQISAATGALADATTAEERNELNSLLVELKRRATWAAPACVDMTAGASWTVTPIVANTVTPLTNLPTIVSPAGTSKTPLPLATLTATSSANTLVGTQIPTQTPIPTVTPTVQPTLTPTPVPVGNGEFVAVFPSIQKSNKGASVGDFDGDGDSDVAVGLSNSLEVRIYLNDGGGIFREGQLLSLTTAPGDLHVRDIDSDGILDLVISHDVGTSITIIPGQGISGIGNGTFGTPGTHQVSSSSSLQTLYIGHLDSDPVLDIAVSLANQNKVTVSLGNGNGTFQLAQDVITSIPGAQQIDGGDFDNDGDLDLVVGNSTAGLVVLVNNGSGVFSNGGTVSCGSPSNSITDLRVLDFSGDAEPDLVALNGTTSDICLSAGDPGVANNTFGSPAFISTGAGNPQRFLVRDFNGDTEPDLLVGNSNGRLQVFTGQTSGPEFVASSDSVMIGGTSVTSMNLADLNGSATDDDIVVATDSSANLNGLAVLLSAGGADFLPPGSYKTGAEPVDLVAEDLNRDGLRDIVTVNTGSADVSVFLNLGGGVFSSGVTYPVTNEPKAVGLGDLSGDGLLDIVVATTNSGALLWAQGDGNGGFGAFSPIAGSLVSSPTSVYIADIDDDRLNDIVFSNSASTIGIGRVRTSAGGSFAPQSVISYASPLMDMAIGKINGDTDPDIAFVTSSDMLIRVLTGTSGLGFGAMANLSTAPVIPVATKILDFDLDGDGDIMALLPTQYVLYENTGATFAAPAIGGSSTTLNQPKGLDGADVNNDGIMDLVVANYGSGIVRVFPGQPGSTGSASGLFGGGTPYFVGHQPKKVRLVDVTGDNISDLIVLTTGSNWVSVMKGKSN
jgi:hypothetical protein